MFPVQNREAAAQARSDDQTVTTLTASATLRPDQQVVLVNAAADVTVTLPPVLAAKGMTFLIVQKHATGTEEVTVTDQDDGLIPMTNVVIDVINGYALVYSSGLQWHVLDSVIAP